MTLGQSRFGGQGSEPMDVAMVTGRGQRGAGSGEEQGVERSREWRGAQQLRERERDAWQAQVFKI